VEEVFCGVAAAANRFMPDEIQPKLAFSEREKKDDSVAKFQPLQANIAITIIIPGIKNNSTAVVAAAAGHNNNKKPRVVQRCA
jgi:hypothetical protein